jgi:arabinofuranan 3-O-arabinosyltransferase
VTDLRTAAPSAGRDGRRSAATAVLWLLALAAAGHLVLRSYLEDRYIGDFRVLQDGAMRFWDGVSVYADPWFLLTPSGLLAMLPFGLLGPHAGFVVWNTLSIGAVAAGCVWSLRFVGARLTGPVAAVTLLGVPLSESLTSTLILGNLNNSLLMALGAGFLLADLRGRTVLAGVLLGAALALKPVFVLLLLIPLLRRRWTTLSWAVALPLVLNVVGLALVPAPSDFVTRTVPGLLHGRKEWNNSLWSMGVDYGLPDWAIVALRLLVLLLTGLAVWRFRRVEDAVVRSAATYGVLLLATFLASSLSQAYYSLLLVPLLLSVVRAGSPLRTPVAWVAVYAFAAQDSWSIPRSPGWTETVGDVRWTSGWALLLAVLVTTALRVRPTDDPQVPERQPALVPAG